MTAIAVSDALTLAAAEASVRPGALRSAIAAATYTCWRAASVRIAMSAIMNWTPWKSAMAWPNCLRSFTYAMVASSAPCAMPTAWAPMVSRVWSRVRSAVLKPVPSSPTSREAGSDAAAMKTRARLEGDTWVLNGTKAWITNSGVSEWYTVMAVTDPEKRANGISAFVVHRDDPGFSVGTKERKLGIKGSPTCEISFEDCRIPASRMIGAEGTGFKTALKTLDHTRSMIGAQAVGIAQGALDAAVAYTKERSQFGKRIADFQGVQFMLADMAMKTEAARQLVYVAAASAERGDPDLTFLSSASKTFASDTAMSVTTDAVQLFGGYGYTQDFPVERMMRDAKITQIYEGTNQVQRMVMARTLLK